MHDVNYAKDSARLEPAASEPHISGQFHFHLHPVVVGLAAVGGASLVDGKNEACLEET